MSFQDPISSPRAFGDSGRAKLLCPAFLVLWFLAWGQSRVVAQSSPSPIPEFTGARVYVSGVADEYSSLRDDIARLERSSSQTYYVAVVRFAGPGKKATRSYLEQMIAQWESQSRKRGVPFDEKRSVIVLLTIENRQIIVLGGEELQERYGFRDPYIERDLIQPHFISYARAGDYSRGLRVLLTQIDRWISDRDKSLASHRQESVAREAQLKTDAQSALQTSKQLLGETRKEVEAYKAKGTQLDAVETRVRRASDDIDAAARRISSSPGEALDLAQQSERALQEVLDQLQRISARQTEIDGTLQKSTALAAQVLKAIEDAGRESLPIAPVHAELDAANAQIEQARQALKSDPEKAEALAAKISNHLHATLEHVKELPDLRHDVEQKTHALLTLEKAAKADFDRARSAGVDSDDLKNIWSKASSSLASARQNAGADDRRSLASFKEAEATLLDFREKAQARVDRHFLYTRTVPLMFFGIFSACVLAVLAALWYRKRRLQGMVDAQFKGFREKAVALMDKLDALRHRHKTLPATDPDYSQPLTGETLALYQGVEKDLNALWDRWLRVMEVWDQAQKLVRSGSGLAVAKTEEAKKLIENEGNFQEILGECNSCQQRLDRLNQAHEQARDALKAARNEENTLRKSLDTIAAAGLPTDPYSKEQANVDGLFSQAEGLLVADPIGAGLAIGHSRQALVAIAQRAGKVLTRLKEADAVLTTVNEVAAQASDLRSKGVKLTEDEANPDHGIEQARTQQAAAMDALRNADPEGASALISEAKSLVDHASKGIDSHLRARDTVRKDLPEARDAAGSIRQGIEQTQETLERLRQSFAPESWRDVGGNLDQARARSQTMESLLTRAGEQASDAVQNYLGAVSSLGEAALARVEADRLLQGIADREAALNELARQSRELSAGLDEEVGQARTFFQQNPQAIGPEARRSLDQTVTTYQGLAGLLNQSLPNWPEIQRRLSVVKQGVAVALRQGREDVDGFRRASQKLDQVKQRARSLGAMLSQEEKDRPPANQRYRAAVDALAPLENGGGNAFDWDRLLTQLNEVEGNLDRAESLAKEDISLANGAIAEIGQADRTIREVRAFYEVGVTADVTAAETELARARGALASQSYEQAIDFANGAEKAANEARERAGYEARRRRMRVESERVFKGPDASVVIAAAQAAAQAAGYWIGTQAAQAQARPRAFPRAPEPAPAPGPGSGASTGSWDSGPSQGNWTQGADQAGW